MKLSLIFPVLAAALCHSMTAPESEKPAARHRPGHALYPPNQIKWQDGPPSLPAGAKFALLEGNPGEEGFFTMRIWMPDGYKIPPHTHPKVEHVTVISGTFNFGMGDKFDKASTQEMP